MSYLEKINNYSSNLLNNHNDHDNYKLLKYINKYNEQEGGDKFTDINFLINLSNKSFIRLYLSVKIIKKNQKVLNELYEFLVSVEFTLNQFSNIFKLNNNNKSIICSDIITKSIEDCIKKRQNDFNNYNSDIHEIKIYMPNITTDCSTELHIQLSNNRDIKTNNKNINNKLNNSKFITDYIIEGSNIRDVNNNDKTKIKSIQDINNNLKNDEKNIINNDMEKYITYITLYYILLNDINKLENMKVTDLYNKGILNKFKTDMDYKIDDYQKTFTNYLTNLNNNHKIKKIISNQTSNIFTPNTNIQQSLQSQNENKNKQNILQNRGNYINKVNITEENPVYVMIFQITQNSVYNKLSKSYNNVINMTNNMTNKFQKK